MVSIFKWTQMASEHSSDRQRIYRQRTVPNEIAISQGLSGNVRPNVAVNQLNCMKFDCQVGSKLTY